MKRAIVAFAFVFAAAFSSYGSLISVNSVDIWEDGSLFVRSAAQDNRVYFLPSNSLIKKETLSLVYYAKQNGLQWEISYYSTPNGQGYYQLQSARVNF